MPASTGLLARSSRLTATSPSAPSSGPTTASPTSAEPSTAGNSVSSTRYLLRVVTGELTVGGVVSGGGGTEMAIVAGEIPVNCMPAVTKRREAVIESRRRLSPGDVEMRRYAAASLPSIRFDQRVLTRVRADADSSDFQPSAFICAPMKLLSSPTVFGVSTVISEVNDNGDVLELFCITMMALSGTVSRGSTPMLGIAVTCGALIEAHGTGLETLTVTVGGVRPLSSLTVAVVSLRQKLAARGRLPTNPPGLPKSGSGFQPDDRNSSCHESTALAEFTGTSTNTCALVTVPRGPPG